jgi:hypothetical protein
MATPRARSEKCAAVLGKIERENKPLEPNRFRPKSSRFRGSLIVRVLAVMISGVILAGAAAAASKAPAKKTAAPVEPPMRVHIVRSAQDGCEPNCPEWIAAQGRIEAGALAQFKKVLSQLGKRNLPVLIHSGGGLADEALAIGNLVRGKGLDVAVARTVFIPCAPNAPGCGKKQANKVLRGLPEPGFSLCASGCAFVLAAGARRFVGASALVGVHRAAAFQTKVMRTYKMTPYRAGNGSVRYKRTLIAQKVISQRQVTAPQTIYDKYEKYFVAMGVSKDIMPMMLATANTSIRWMTRAELRSTRIATHGMDGAQLVFGAPAPEDGWTSPSVTGAIPAAPPKGRCQQFGGSPLACSIPLTSAPSDGASLPSTPSR